MRAERLLRLYPRAWRDRYGDEFLAMLGREPLQLRQAIDILSGAIDAWLSADVRGATRVAGPTGGQKMIMTRLICQRDEQRYTTRDGLIGAAVMLIGSLVLSLSGLALRRNGWPTAGEIVLSSSFFVSMTLSMPFWLMKHQPWKAQVAIVGATLLVLAAANVIAVTVF